MCSSCIQGDCRIDAENGANRDGLFFELMCSESFVVGVGGVCAWVCVWRLACRLSDCFQVLSVSCFSMRPNTARECECTCVYGYVRVHGLCVCVCVAFLEMCVFVCTVCVICGVSGCGSACVGVFCVPWR